MLLNLEDEEGGSSDAFHRHLHQDVFYLLSAHLQCPSRIRLEETRASEPTHHMLCQDVFHNGGQKSEKGGGIKEESCKSLPSASSIPHSRTEEA